MNTTEQNPRTYGDLVTIVVDEQNDFFPGGALGVTDGDKVVDPTNALTEFTHDNGGMVVFTRDKHPQETKHFAVNNGGEGWPVHCVQFDGMDQRAQGTEGAALHQDLVVRNFDAVASKGTSLEDDGYSGMEAVIEQGQSVLGTLVHDLPAAEQTVERAVTRMVDVNRELGARTLILVCGLATDYCVKATVLDALHATDRTWADVVVIEDAIRAVNLAYEDGAKAMAEMKADGALFAQSFDVIEGGILINRRGEQ